MGKRTFWFLINSILILILGCGIIAAGTIAWALYPRNPDDQGCSRDRSLPWCQTYVK